MVFFFCSLKPNKTINFYSSISTPESWSPQAAPWLVEASVRKKGGLRGGGEVVRGPGAQAVGTCFLHRGLLGLCWWWLLFTGGQMVRGQRWPPSISQAEKKEVLIKVTLWDGRSEHSNLSVQRLCGMYVSRTVFPPSYYSHWSGSSLWMLQYITS